MKPRRPTALASLKPSPATLISGAAAVDLAGHAAAQITVSNLWSISTADGRDYVTCGAFGRGITTNPATGHTIPVSGADGQKVVMLDCDAGVELGRMDASSSIVAGGTFALTLIGELPATAIFTWRTSPRRSAVRPGSTATRTRTHRRCWFTRRFRARPHSGHQTVFGVRFQSRSSLPDHTGE